VSVRQSNKILRLIVASSRVFYLSEHTVGFEVSTPMLVNFIFLCIASTSEMLKVRSFQTSIKA